MTADDVRISDWSSDVCSSDLRIRPLEGEAQWDTGCRLARPSRTALPAGVRVEGAAPNHRLLWKMEERLVQLAARDGSPPPRCLFGVGGHRRPAAEFQGAARRARRDPPPPAPHP